MFHFDFPTIAEEDIRARKKPTMPISGTNAMSLA